MTDDNTVAGVVFDDLFGKQVVARFDQPDASSDGGALLLGACDQQLGLTGALSTCLVDKRQAGKVAHSLRELVCQRVYAIGCGHEDCNDAARLKADPIHKMLMGRDPVGGADLASQATLSRFENGVSASDCMRMSDALADQVLGYHKRRLGKRARRITVELDGTDDQTHGGQQLTFFNAFYGGYCYQPLCGFVQFDDEPDQYLLAYALRPGNAWSARGADGMLSRLLSRIGRLFPRARVLVRLDAGFAGPQILDVLDRYRVDYVIGMGTNQKLERLSAPLMAQVRERCARDGESHKAYGEIDAYRARSWQRSERIIYKAQVLVHEGRRDKANARYVITNLKHTPRWIYERVYCGRANIENRIKELKRAMRIDRTSCTRFVANQFRALLAAAAYMLMQHLRLKAARAGLRTAQVQSLRNALIKLGAWVKRSTRRIVLHLPDSAPWRHAWCQVARALGAVPG